MPKKKIVDEYESGKEVDLQELAETTRAEPLEDAPAKTKAASKSGRFIILSDFEYFGKEYKVGDEFIMPAEWTRDAEYDEFARTQSLKQRSASGIAFTYPGEIVDQKTKERQVHRAILPLKEE